MIIVNEDGTKRYYYYKKKIGRHKKPGPKPCVKDKRYYLGKSLSFYKQYTSKYKSVEEFKSNEPLIYECCLELGFVDVLYSYKYLYNQAQCKEACKGFETSDDLMVENYDLYEYIKFKGWLPVVFPYHKDKYSKSNCYQIASQYKTYKEFRDGYPCIYEHCLHKDWLKSFTWLIDDRVCMFKDKVDCVYMYLFEELNSVYIGRTLERRLSDRDHEHVFGNDTVSNFSKKNNVPIPKIVVLSSGLTISEGLEKEKYYIDQYKEQGYNILNKAKTGLGSGSIGSLGKGKWTKDKCYQVALNCKTVTEFDKKYPSACRLARQNGWVQDYTWFKEKPKRNYWNYDTCKEVSKGCSSVSEFIKKYPTAYAVSLKNNWLNEFFDFKGGYKYMKGKKIYKIDVETMKVIDEYKKVSEITSDGDIYRVLNGYKQVYKDGYMYRRSCDIEVNKETGIVVDLLKAKSKRDKRYDKYEYTIDLLKNTQYSISEICRLSILKGIKICEATCRQLQKEYALKELD